MTDTGKGRDRKILTRVTAAVLAVIMLSGILVYRQAGVLVTPEPSENKAVRLAAQQLLAENEYANASRLARMGDLTGIFLHGRRTSADYDISGQIAAAQGEYEDASALTAKAIELYEGEDARAADLYFRMGYLQVLLNRYEDASRWLALGLELSPSPEVRLVQAQVLVNLGETDAAMKEVAAYLETSEDAEKNLAELTNVYEAAGDFETAAGIYARLREATGNIEYALNEAYCQTSAGHPEKAETVRSAYAADGGKELSSVDVMLGIGWLRGGAYEQAGGAFARAIEENYSDPESLYYYVVLCAYINGDYERTCEYGDRLIARITRGEQAETAEFEVEKTTGRLDVKLARMDVSSMCLMTGAAHVRLGNYEQAVDSLTACLAANQEEVYAHYLRGSCLLAAERYEEAIPDFDAALAAEEEPEKSHYSRGVCRMELGDRAGAVEDFEWVLFHGEDEELFQESGLLISQLLNEEAEPEKAGNSDA